MYFKDSVLVYSNVFMSLILNHINAEDIDDL